MKMQIPFKAFILAAGATAMVAMSGCKQGPVNYDNFEQRTIKANLAAIDSAQVLYHAQLAAGDIDAAAQQACQFLLTQPGVNTAEIAPDSTVWAHFTNGLLAGTGDIERPSGGRTNATLSDSGRRQAPNREPAVRTASGGEVFNVASYLLPFPDELPGTVDASAALMGIFQTKLNWQSESVAMGHQVDLEKVLNLIKNGRSVCFWSGHGTLVAPDSGDSACIPGLLLGKSYGDDDAASAAAVQYADYLNPGEGQERQAAMVKFENDPAWYLVILPGFIRAHGYFDGTEAMPGYPFCKTVVMLSTCYSAYSPAGAPGDMIQAFRSVGRTWFAGTRGRCMTTSPATRTLLSLRRWPTPALPARPWRPSAAGLTRTRSKGIRPCLPWLATRWSCCRPCCRRARTANSTRRVTGGRWTTSPTAPRY